MTDHTGSLEFDDATVKRMLMESLADQGLSPDDVTDDMVAEFKAELMEMQGGAELPPPSSRRSRTPTPEPDLDLDFDPDTDLDLDPISSTEMAVDPAIADGERPRKRKKSKSKRKINTRPSQRISKTDLPAAHAPTTPC